MPSWTVTEPRRLDPDEQVVSSTDFAGLTLSAHRGGGRLGAGTGRLSAVAVSGQVTLLRRPVDNEFAR